MAGKLCQKWQKSQILWSVSRHPGRRTGKSCCVCHVKHRHFIQNQETAILPQKKPFKNIVLGVVENKTHIVTEVRCFWDQQTSHIMQITRYFVLKYWILNQRYLNSQWKLKFLKFTNKTKKSENLISWAD